MQNGLLQLVFLPRTAGSLSDAHTNSPELTTGDDEKCLWKVEA
ncbi:hypothetical protein BJ970_007451 [Saccharopolyspora phatthalungensis]|uniref:Uncharacterized protein n=1 Tax=Saccharopolyspora phatthalungensis TaxID=664693 RepID=A0A840QHY4_9PSEU|nr:hypothetical protein [Saccharopolyspora phatthalungensis]